LNNPIDTYRHKGLRKNLIREITEKGIKNEKVLEAMEKVPRHFFFDDAFVEQAYSDKAFPIGEGQTISQPFTVAYQTDLLNIKRLDKVLEIGTGSGYQTCILLELGAKVYTIERQKVLFERTKLKLLELGYKARFFCADGSLGLPMHAPFDKILVTAGAPFIPQTLMDQLVIGGLLVIPVGDEKAQIMTSLLKTGMDTFEKQESGTFRFVPLKGDQAW
jgi:protein-L-isoaspartate(D-aspartate) O-methyltransferase